MLRGISCRCSPSSITCIFALPLKKLLSLLIIFFSCYWSTLIQWEENCCTTFTSNISICCFVMILVQVLKFTLPLHSPQITRDKSISNTPQMWSMKCHIMAMYNFQITLSAQRSVGVGYGVITCRWVCIRKLYAHSSTYGPQSTRRERTLSIPMSHTFIHSPLISMQRPWKFSWS